MSDAWMRQVEGGWERDERGERELFPFPYYQYDLTMGGSNYDGSRDILFSYRMRERVCVGVWSSPFPTIPFPSEE